MRDKLFNQMHQAILTQSRIERRRKRLSDQARRRLKICAFTKRMSHRLRMKRQRLRSTLLKKESTLISTKVFYQTMVL